MAINLSDNVHVSAPKPVESKYLNITAPYTTCAQVNSCILSGERYTGLTVNILGSEYWYKTGVADVCLISKSGGGGTITGATNGLSISGTNIALGGTLTCHTYIDGNAGTYNLSLCNINAFNLGFTSASVITDNGTNGGIKYGGDYSACYTARSLVDCAFVIFKTSGATSCATLSVFTITGNSTNTGFTITHNKNKTFVGVEIIKNTSPYPTIYTSVSRPTTNTVCVTFDTALTTGQQYKILITS